MAEPTHPLGQEGEGVMASELELDCTALNTAIRDAISERAADVDKEVQTRVSDCLTPPGLSFAHTELRRR